MEATTKLLISIPTLPCFVSSQSFDLFENFYLLHAIKTFLPFKHLWESTIKLEMRSLDIALEICIIVCIFHCARMTHLV